MDRDASDETDSTETDMVEELKETIESVSKTVMHESEKLLEKFEGFTQGFERLVSDESGALVRRIEVVVTE